MFSQNKIKIVFCYTEIDTPYFSNDSNEKLKQKNINIDFLNKPLSNLILVLKFSNTLTDYSQPFDYQCTMSYNKVSFALLTISEMYLHTKSLSSLHTMYSVIDTFTGNPAGLSEDNARTGD